MGQAVGIVGASGYGGVELVRLLDAAPRARRGRGGRPLPGGRARRRRCSRTCRRTRSSTRSTSTSWSTSTWSSWPRRTPPRWSSGPRCTTPGPARSTCPGPSGWTPTGSPPGTARTTRAPTWPRPPFGLTEWHRDDVVGATLVANPGCYPTATLLALLPLAGLVAARARSWSTRKSGTSGAGRGREGHPALRPRPRRRHRLRRPDPPPHRRDRAVALARPGNGRRGLAPPRLRGPGRVQFTPHLMPDGPRPAGDVWRPCVTGSARRRQDALHAAYDDEPFVHRPAARDLPAHQGRARLQRLPRVSARGRAHGARGRDRRAIDNLGKGAAGQALQNANLLLEPARDPRPDRDRDLPVSGVVPQATWGPSDRSFLVPIEGGVSPPRRDSGPGPPRRA